MIFHSPVMLAETVSVLNPSPGKIIVDGTVGEGGHAVALVEKIKPGGILMGIDRDEDNLAIAEERLKKTGAAFKLFKGTYSGMEGFLKKEGVKGADGVLLDLGFSMRQIKNASRGFSFNEDSPLDMRYDTSNGISAESWLREAEITEIKEVLKKFGQEDESARVARCLKKLVEEQEGISAIRAAEAVSQAKRKKKKRINPATKTFQAIRIHINSELEELKKGLEAASLSLCRGGRLVVLTYHSIEDRIVKDFLFKFSGSCQCPSGMPVCGCGALSRRPLLKVLPDSGSAPSEKEKAKNPASRSARLRAAEVVLK